MEELRDLAQANKYKSVSAAMRYPKAVGRRPLRAAFQIVMTLALLPCFCFAQTSAKQDEGPVRLTKDGREWAQQILRGLSLEEKVGQMLQVRYYADYPDFESIEYKHLREELQKYHIGSVVFGMRFNRQGPVRSSPVDAAKVANQLQRDSKLPLLLAADIERGVASRVHDVPSFAWPMAFGAVGNAKEVENFAAVTAQEARAIGIQWALAPVADVNSNPANPVINTRSFGEDPDQVSALVVAFIRGAHKNGLLVTAKHFPGNGDASVDSHHRIASIEGDLAHLQKFEFPPFKQAIDAGVDSIMLAHARVPALESDSDKIATVSSKVVSESLKNQLGFKGVVVTDALEMLGLTKIYDPQIGSPTARAAVDAVKAGCDVISIPTDLDGAFRAVVDAVHNGEIPGSRIDESVRKILEMKASVGLHKSRFVDLDQVSVLTSKPQDMDFAQHVADEAVTLVRDNKRVLPLFSADALPTSSAKSGGNLNIGNRLAVILLDEAFTSTDGKEFEKAVKARRPDATVLYFDNRMNSTVADDAMKAVTEADQVVLAVYVAHNGVRHIVADGKLLSSFGPLGPSGHLLEQILTAAADKTVVIALGSPYLIINYPEIRTYICTYSQPSTSEISAVKALFGEIQNHAKLPVTLPGIAPRGFSLPWPAQHQSSEQAPVATP
jgi:beta-N-acetylhexosaminidase